MYYRHSCNLRKLRYSFIASHQINRSEDIVGRDHSVHANPSPLSRFRGQVCIEDKLHQLAPVDQQPVKTHPNNFVS